MEETVQQQETNVKTTETQGQNQKEKTKKEVSDKTKTFQRLLQRKTELAKRNDTVVIIVNGKETRGLIELICAIDLAAERLRNRVTTVKKEKAEEINSFLLNDYREMIKQIDAFAKKIAEMGNVNYKTPKSLKNILED